MPHTHLLIRRTVSRSGSTLRKTGRICAPVFCSTQNASVHVDCQYKHTYMTYAEKTQSCELFGSSTDGVYGRRQFLQLIRANVRTSCEPEVKQSEFAMQVPVCESLPILQAGQTVNTRDDIAQ
jgi:hypothetical protein